MHRALALWIVAAGACDCGAPQRVAQAMAGVDVVVDADAGTIALSRGGHAVLAIDAADVGARHVARTYDMQFGMFDIAPLDTEDGAPPFAFATHLEVTGAPTPDHVAFTLLDDASPDSGPLADGALTVRGSALELAVVARRDLDDVIVKSACPFAHVIGFGAQGHDVDHVGQRVPLWVSEQGVGATDDDALPAVWQLVGRRHTSSAPVPAFVAALRPGAVAGSAGAAAYVLDTSAYARVDACADGETASFEVWEPRLRLRVHAADTPADAQRAMVDALGRARAPPPWAFAPWNDAIFGSDNVRAVAARLRALRIPSSAIWTEDWRGGRGDPSYRLDEDWGPDPALYPDFDAMVQDVRALGFQQMVYFNTFVVTGVDVFDEVNARSLCIQSVHGGCATFAGPDRDLSPTTLIDVTNPDARAFVKDHLRDALARGVRGWMADFGEWLPVDGVLLHDGEDPALVHNRYPAEWQQINREALDEAGADDAIAFVRSAHLGAQPLAQVIWAGDQRTSFDADDGLPTVIPIGVGLATAGFPYFTHDVAGYQSATNPPGDKELFYRWTELGAFTPVMRTHHGTHARLNVNLFTDDETTAHWKRYAQLHTRLYPYLRALALGAAAPGGAPLWIPLPLAFPADDAVWVLKDEVLLGPALLIAPVVEKGAIARTVVFPSARFAPFAPFTPPSGPPAAPAPGDVVIGPASVSVDAALGEIPVFIVAGGIVPTTTTAVDTLLPTKGRGPRAPLPAPARALDGLEAVEGDRTVYVGLGASGSFTEESGASYALDGAGTAAPASAEPDGAVVVAGDAVIQGDGFTFTLAGHPPSRVTRVQFR